MVPADLRQFIQALEKTGDVVRIKQEVDWDIEVGAIMRRVNELQDPAPLFEKIKGYPEGFRILGTPMGTKRRMAVALGLDPEAPYSLIESEFERRMANPIKPMLVKDAPCKENILMGDEVDLYRIPAPMIHDGDGGRYIGTASFIAAKDPDSDWTNWGMYRVMVRNHRHMVGLVGRWGDMGQIFWSKYVPKKQPMPVALVLGASPLCITVGMTPIPSGQSEVDYAGGLHEKPIPVVKCETSDLLVPANAEIIVEAELLPEACVEGPFGEYPGYRSAPRYPRPVFRVKAITYRHDPILAVICHGILIDENWVHCMTTALELKKLLKSHKVPVTGLYIPPETKSNLAVVGVKAAYSNVATQVANLIFGAGILVTHLVVVDEDVDITDLREVIHAMVFKCHPARGINVRDRELGLVLTPFLSLDERTWGKGARVLFDCTWPLDWPKETALPPKIAFDTYPPEVRDRVLANWETYGFKPTRLEKVLF